MDKCDFQSFVLFYHLMETLLAIYNFYYVFIQEFDPPPWFNRMREIGYPPGYLGEHNDFTSNFLIYIRIYIYF